MPHRSLPIHFAAGLNKAGEPSPAPMRDIIWDRPIFRAPLLSNPRVIFDPLPFRTQFYSAARRLSRFARRDAA